MCMHFQLNPFISPIHRLFRALQYTHTSRQSTNPINPQKTPSSYPENLRINEAPRRITQTLSPLKPAARQMPSSRKTTRRSYLHASRPKELVLVLHLMSSPPAHSTRGGLMQLALARQGLIARESECLSEKLYLEISFLRVVLRVFFFFFSQVRIIVHPRVRMRACELELSRALRCADDLGFIKADWSPRFFFRLYVTSLISCVCRVRTWWNTRKPASIPGLPLLLRVSWPLNREEGERGFVWLRGRGFSEKGYWFVVVAGFV